MFATQTLTLDEMNAAKERGRQMAAEAMRINPESKHRVEERFGEEYCRKHYPEAYTPRR